VHLQLADENMNYRIGVISDTHGLLREEAIGLLKGVDLILHAGDVGNQELLDTLEKVAPVFAVRGNMDRGEWSQGLPQTQWVEVGEITIYILHDLDKLDLLPQAAGISMVVSGHTHQPEEEYRDGVYYLNPGSVGPRRFNKPVSMAIVEVMGRNLNAEIIKLKA
jgi:putative phosphoesterase